MEGRIFTTDNNGFYSVSLDKPELIKFNYSVTLLAYSKDSSNSSKIKLSDVLEEQEGQEVKVELITGKPELDSASSNILKRDDSLKNIIYLVYQNLLLKIFHMNLFLFWRL